MGWVYGINEYVMCTMVYIWRVEVYIFLGIYVYFLVYR